jgi:NAD(P) transhydrogenase subunit alpha
MIVAIPKETIEGENRVAAIPATVKELIKKGMTVHVQKSAGDGSYIFDQDYIESGASIIEDIEKLYSNADMILKVNHPVYLEELKKYETDLMREGSVFISLFQTTREKESVQRLVDKKITGFSMHLIPRTTLAQKMDALSSQSNIGGYKAVIIGALHLGKYMPLLMTAAGTIPPARVLILGAGVAGLQAIATAKRLGAKFVEVDATGDEGVGKGGYAKETSDDYQKRQRKLIKEHMAKTDIVITTALIPGKPAPILIPKDMVEEMQPGSVIIDLAAENGGNCELTKPNELIQVNKVIIDGRLNIPGSMPVHASQLYAKNITSFVTYLCPEGEMVLNLEDEIINGALFTHNGEIVHEPTKIALEN